METNLIHQLIEALNSRQGVVGSNAITIWGMVIFALMPTLAAVVTFLQSRAAMNNMRETKQTAVTTAETVQKIHSDVNSERTAMIDKVEKLTDEVLRISKEKAILEEMHRSQGTVREPPQRPLTREDLVAALRELQSDK